MSIIERYKWFKAGIVKRGTDELMQYFFKTNPTDEQLMYLDEMNNKNNNAFGVGIFIAGVMGAIVGGAIVYFYLYFKFLMGLPLF